MKNSCVDTIDMEAEFTSKSCNIKQSSNHHLMNYYHQQVTLVQVISLVYCWGDHDIVSIVSSGWSQVTTQLSQWDCG